MNDLTIGKVAAAAGVPVATIRFYERQGLVPAPGRNASGYRVYDPATVDRLRFIVRAKALGFTLEEIRELLMLRVDEQATCREIREIAAEKIAMVRKKIRTLQEMERALTTLSAECGAGLEIDECPILTYLSRKDDDD